MSIVLDYTTRISPAALKAAGVSGVCRYLKPLNVPAYAITPAEYRELVGAGISVTLNWEYDEHDWLGGASRGAAHGTEAARQARKVIGYPAGGVLVGSADFDMTRAQWDSAGHAYAQAFAAAVRAAGFRPGVYGPADVLTWVRDAGIMDAFWQAGMSTSWSGGRNRNAWPGAHLRQRDHKMVAGQDTDWNEILVPDWGRTAEGDIVGNAADIVEAWSQGMDHTPSNLSVEPVKWEVRRQQWQATVDAKLAAAAATQTTLLQLLQTATSDGTSLDTAAVSAAIAAEHETTRALMVDQHAAAMAALTQQHAAELAGLRAELAALGG